MWYQRECIISVVCHLNVLGIGTSVLKEGYTLCSGAYSGLSYLVPCMWDSLQNLSPLFSINTSWQSDVKKLLVPSRTLWSSGNLVAQVYHSPIDFYVWIYITIEWYISSILRYAFFSHVQYFDTGIILQ